MQPIPAAPKTSSHSEFGDHFHLHLSSLILPTFNPVGHSTENMQYFALSPILTINEGIWEQTSSICRVFTSYQALCYPSSPFGRQVSIAGEAPTPVHFSSLSTPLSKPPPTHTHLRIQIQSSLQLFTPSLSWLNWDALVRLGWDKQDKIPAFESLLPVDPQAGEPRSAAPHLSHTWSPDML